MKKNNLIPLLGVVFNAVLFLLSIHYWLADWYAEAIGISPRTARWFLMTFTALYFSVRGLRIALNKDATTRKIDQWLEDKFHDK